MKLLLMNYKPYEYQLLQEKLDSLTSQGYYPKSMGFITVFKKEESHEHLVVDVFKPSAKDYEGKMREQQAFLDAYLDASYNVLYANKNGLYVLNGEATPPAKYLEKHNVMDKRYSYKYLFMFTLMLVALLIFAFTMNGGTSFTTTITYGSCLMPGALVLLLFGLVYYYYDLFLNTFRFDRNKLNKVVLKDKINYFLHLIILVTGVLCIGGCLIEDVLNTQNISVTTHPILSAKDVYSDLKMVDETYTVNHGLYASNYYHYKAKSDDQYILEVKEFYFNDSSSYYNQIINSPSLINCDLIESKVGYDLGTYHHENNILIVHDKTKIVIVNVMGNITSSQIETITQYYK